ncbi:hypothetical protein O9929_18260 [Vibrio lentus]|nr:hypothetical protein [Vibrio lentus]
MLTYAHVPNVIGAVARVRNCLSQAIHRFHHHEQGFFWTSDSRLSLHLMQKALVKCSVYLR